MESYFCTMLAGIHIHINGDLPRVIAKLRYKEEDDFEKINTILEETIPSVMKYLAFEEHDIVGAGGMVLKKYVHQEFTDVIVNWRRQAWKNAQKLRKEPALEKELLTQTEKMTLEIIKLFSGRMYVTRIKKIVETLHEMKVEI